MDSGVLCVMMGLIKMKLTLFVDNWAIPTPIYLGHTSEWRKYTVVCSHVCDVHIFMINCIIFYTVLLTNHYD